LEKPKRTFRAEKTDDYDPVYSEQHLTQQPVAVYYRQSTPAQVGNISTTIQTVDMVDELVNCGWQRDDIILIDADEGVSGTKRIDEREGMSYLFELIADGSIGAVACQDEDRLFRDFTQIQVNIFIDICRKSRVKVLTPFFTYDFAHPLHGEFHARQFRFKCEMAAEYLKSYVLGRLAPARQRLLKEGKWTGARMPVGYMVDNRKRLPDGSESPN
jgi:DNA invertase Pin-like site-specific DNA recombinase